MNLNKLWINDPAHKNRPSVSLTVMLYSIILLSICGLLQVFDKVKSTGPFTELMYSTMALYFGRRFSVKGQDFSSSKAEKIEEKLENKEE